MNSPFLQAMLASMRSPQGDMLDPRMNPKAEAEDWIRREYQQNQVPGVPDGLMQDRLARENFDANVLGLSSPYDRRLWR